MHFKIENLTWKGEWGERLRNCEGGGGGGGGRWRWRHLQRYGLSCYHCSGVRGGWGEEDIELQSPPDNTRESSHAWETFTVSLPEALRRHLCNLRDEGQVSLLKLETRTTSILDVRDKTLPNDWNSHSEYCREQCFHVEEKRNTGKNTFWHNFPKLVASYHNMNEWKKAFSSTRCHFIVSW